MIINNREDWLKWRKSGIGASDSYILMGLADWSSPLKIFEEKTSDEVNEFEGNFATRLGDEAEPKIRSLFELKKGKSFKPALVRSKEFPYILASLDGWSEDKYEIPEIKLINEEDWLAAKNEGKVPEKYYCQIQHQMIASGAKKAYFVCYLFSEYKKNRNKPLKLEYLAIVEVLPDIVYQGKILETATNFWHNHVLKKCPPLEGDNDLVELKDYNEKVDFYLELKGKHAELTEKLTEAKKELEDIASQVKSKRITFGKLNFTRVSKSGSFSASKVPAVKKAVKEIVDKLTDEEKAKYTSLGSVFWKITEVKDEQPSK